MKVYLTKQIHSCFAAVSSEDIFLEYELDWDFTPYVGLNLGRKWSDETMDFEEKVIEVVYNIDDNYFTCYVEPDKTLYEYDLESGHCLIPVDISGDKKRPKLDNIVKKYTDLGWKKRERFK